ncbi:MAG: hypothetical protein ABWZ66_01730 [Pyrinomonadaceae bacterium]
MQNGFKWIDLSLFAKLGLLFITGFIFLWMRNISHKR